jgi:hypothetical protein
MNFRAGCLSASESIVLRAAVDDNYFVSPRSGVGNRLGDQRAFV